MASTYGAVTVQSASPTLIIGANGYRKGTLITNNSTVTIYLGFDSSVTTSTGTPVLASGYFRNSGERDAWRGDIYGIAASSTANVRYMEWQT